MRALKRKDLLNPPNLITLVRLGSIPVLIGLLYLPPDAWHWVAAGLFVVAGLSDLLDGLVARRYQQETTLGKFLDPLADKLLIASVLVMLVGMGRAPAWAAIIIICREVAVTGLRALAATQAMAVPSDRWGKAKTAFQMLAVLLLLPPVAGMHQWGTYALYLATAISLVSGFRYFARFNRLLARKESAEE